MPLVPFEGNLGSQFLLDRPPDQPCFRIPFDMIARLNSVAIGVVVAGRLGSEDVFTAQTIAQFDQRCQGQGYLLRQADFAICTVSTERNLKGW